MSPHHRTRLSLLLVAGLAWGPLAHGLTPSPAWISTGAMTAPRTWHTATPLPSGKILVVGGISTTAPVGTAELYDPLTGTYSPTGSLSVPRSSHTAVLLPSGQVLVAGGRDASLTALSTAELYDPVTGTWTPTGSMSSPHERHTATLLGSGKVLIAGGVNGDPSLSVCELYDPGTRRWTLTAPMGTPRVNHTATLLRSGLVLVAGGWTGTDLANPAELYDPVTERWASTGAPIALRGHHTATLLPSGKVLITGGNNPTGTISSAELFDPAAGNWTAAGSMTSPRYYHSATLLPSGMVLLAGGTPGSGSTATAELYDPTGGTWAAAGSMAAGRKLHTAMLLPSGKVLLAGGNGSTATELYDPAAGSWGVATGRLSWTHDAPAATLLPSGKVLLAGGTNGDIATAFAELYDPASGAWTSAGAMASPRARFTATLLRSGKVLVTGGWQGGALATAELYNPSAGSWTATGSLSAARERHTATLLPSGRVLVIGGNDGVASAEIYDPTKGSWTAMDVPSSRRRHATTLLPSGQVLVTGGSDGLAPLSSAELFDPRTGRWTPAGAMTTAREGHTATLLPSGQVLVAGGNSGGGATTSAELFDPTTGSWTRTEPLAEGREDFTAVLLPSGKVLVAGGSSGGAALGSAELYDPAIGCWRPAPSLTSARARHQATLLPSGKVLVAGGSGSVALDTAELYDDTGTKDTSRPNVDQLSTLEVGAIVTVTGAGFRGISEGSNGTTQNSATDFPAVSLTALAGGRLITLPSWLLGKTTVTVRIPQVTSGSYLLTITANAIPAGTVVQIQDTVAPAAPVILTPAEGAHFPPGESAFEGTAEPGSAVALSLDGAPLGTAPVNEDGGWRLETSVEVLDGRHELTAIATDASGNQGPPSRLQLQVARLGYYGWSCATAPAGASTWIAVALAVWAMLRAGRRRVVSMRSLVALGVLASHQALAAPRTPVPETRNPYVPVVARLYEELEYEAALSTIAQAAAWPENGPRERLWLALMEGVLHIYAADATQEAKALEAFKQALALDPAATLPVHGTPRLRQVFEQARQEMRVPETTAPVPPAAHEAWELRAGVRGEVDGLRRAATPALTAELLGGMLGGALTVIVQPHPGVRAEGRLYPVAVGGARPYVALGATAFFPAVGGRVAAGAEVRLGRFYVSGDVAYERFLDARIAYNPNALLFSLGAGRRF